MPRQNPYLPRRPRTGVARGPLLPRLLPPPPNAPQAPPEQQLVVHRLEAPQVLPYSTGSLQDALTIATSPERRALALQALHQNMWAASSTRPRSAREELWHRIGLAANFSDPFQITVESLLTITSILVAAHYRSTPSILSQAIATFRRRGGEWTPQLELARQDALRAAKRGLGPPRHAAPFPMLRIPDLPDNSEPWVSKGPIGPRNCLSIGCWWLLREIELTNLRLQDVTHLGTNVTLNITVSKTDTAGEGTSRTHTCMCGSLQGAPTLTTTTPCPACTVLRQHRIVSQFPNASTTTPLCPTVSGEVVLK